MNGDTFRERVVSRFVEEFGEPVQLQTVDGPLYRWTLQASSGGHIRITIDSPEFSEIAHVLISNRADMVDPVTSTTLRTMQEVEEIIALLYTQLKRGDLADSS